MTVILAIAVVVAIAFMGLLTTRVTAIEKHRSDTTAFDDLKRYTTESVKTSNGNFASIATRFDKENERIEDIIGQLKAITADIKRLDEEIDKVAKAETEIRRYYINYAIPNALPVYDAGVPWAKDYKVGEDDDN